MSLVRRALHSCGSCRLLWAPHGAPCMWRNCGRAGPAARVRCGQHHEMQPEVGEVSSGDVERKRCIRAAAEPKDASASQATTKPQRRIQPFSIGSISDFTYTFDNTIRYPRSSKLDSLSPTATLWGGHRIAGREGIFLITVSRNLNARPGGRQKRGGGEDDEMEVASGRCETRF